MQASVHAAEKLDREVERRLVDLAALIERFTAEDGMHVTALDCLSLIRSSQPSEPIHTVYKPALCVIAVGMLLVDPAVAFACGWLVGTSYLPALSNLTHARTGA